MKIIRKSVFETNSSSTHVISITKHNNYNIPKHINFKFGEFDWEYETYKDMESKASYLYTMTEYFDGEYIKEFNKRELYLKKIKEYLDEEGITYTFEDRKVNEYGWDDNGHIDHGAYSPEIIEGILESKEKFFRYLFDDRSYITTGNDNDLGYYIPEVGYENDYYDEYNGEEWNRQINRLKEDNDIYFKGN